MPRLSEQFTIETTGSLPQNMNFALTRDELVDFLQANRIDVGPERGSAEGGTPDALEAAVVPLICT